MNVVFIHDHKFVHNQSDNLYYDGSGGVFDYNLWCRYLSVFNNITVVGREVEELPNELMVSSGPRVKFKLINDLKSYKDYFLKTKIVRTKLKEIINENNYAIIRLPSTLGYIAQSVCLELNKPYLIEVVGCPWDTYMNHGSLIGKIMAPLGRFKLKQSTKRAGASIYVTKHFLQKRYPTYGASIAISNVNLNNTISFEEVHKFYEKYIVSPNAEFKIAYIGTFHVKYKGHIVALKAIKEVVKQIGTLQVKMYFVGSGNAEWVMDKAKSMKIDQYIEIVGTLKSGIDGIIPFLDQMHLYIHPSETEGLPRVVLEAMSRGRLVLGSSVGGIPELISEEYRHSAGDFKKLSKDILKVCNNRESWDHIITQNINKSTDYLAHKLQGQREKFIKEQLK